MKKEKEKYPSIFDCRVTGPWDMRLKTRHPSKKHTRIITPHIEYVLDKCKTEEGLSTYLEGLAPGLGCFCVSPKKSGFYSYYGRDTYYLEEGKFYMCYYKVYGDYESSREEIQIIVEYEYEDDDEYKERIEQYLESKVKKHEAQVKHLEAQITAEQLLLDKAKEKLETFRISLEVEDDC